MQCTTTRELINWSMRDIPGYEGKYLATKDGKIVANGTRKVVLKPYLSNCGYETVTLWKDKNQRNTRTVHRLIALTHIDNKCRKPFVNHKDGNKRNNNISNLEWVTRLENARHASVMGLLDGRCAGETNGLSKLTARQVNEIRRLRNAGVPVSALVKKYKVSQSNIYLILAGKTWSHIN